MNHTDFGPPDLLWQHQYRYNINYTCTIQITILTVTYESISVAFRTIRIFDLIRCPLYDVNVTISLLLGGKLIIYNLIV